MEGNYGNNDLPKEGIESLDLDTYPLIMDSRLFYSLMKRSLPHLVLGGKHFTEYLSDAESLAENKVLPENGSVHEVMRRPLLFQSITPPNIRRDKIKEDPANPRSSRFFKGNLDASIRLNINGILSLILQDQPPGRQEYPDENPATGQTFRKQLALDLLAIRDNEIVIKWSYPLRNVSLYRGIDPDGRARPFMQITEVEENPAGAGGGAGAMEGGRRRKRTRTKRRKSKSKKSRRR